MTFDKQKVMRSAERYLMQGKIRSAIDEYAVIVKQDSKDVNTLNMLGDLYVRVGEKAEAVKCFTSVAEHYDKQGFSQKAIAVYNKISRLIPDSITVSEKLAPLYHQKGSLAEARTHYKILADDYQKRGKKIEALNILKKIAELDPYNTEICLKLADSYLQENYKEDALAAFIEAGNRFITKRNFESAVTVFNRALEINALDWVALNGYVSSQISLGNSIEAAERLEELHNENPYNTDVMLLLADCYIDQKKLKDAERVLIELVAKEPANYFKLIDLVYANLKINDLDSAVRALNVVAEHLLVGGKNDEYKKIVDEFLTRDAEHTGALRLLVRYYTWLQDPVQIKITLERLASSARVNDLIEDERYALSQLITISPHETQFSQRLAEIGGVMKFEAETSNKGIFAEAEEFQGNGVPAFENFEQLSSDDDPSAEFDNNSFETTQSFDFSAENQTEFQTENETEFPSETSNEIQTDESYLFTSSNVSAESETETITQTSDLNEYDFSDSITSFEDAIFSTEDTSAETFDNQDLSTETEIDSLSPSLQAHLQQELESIKFYISSSYYDLAKESLDSVERQFGARPEIKSLREEIFTNLRAAENATEENSAKSPETIETEEISQANFAQVLGDDEFNETEVETESNQVIVSADEIKETQIAQENISEEITETATFIQEAGENQSVDFAFTPQTLESNLSDFESDDSFEVANYVGENSQKSFEDETKSFEIATAETIENTEVSLESAEAKSDELSETNKQAEESFAKFETEQQDNFESESLETFENSQSEFLAEIPISSENLFAENQEIQEAIEEKVETQFDAENLSTEETENFASEENKTSQVEQTQNVEEFSNDSETQEFFAPKTIESSPDEMIEPQIEAVAESQESETKESESQESETQVQTAESLVENTEEIAEISTKETETFEAVNEVVEEKISDKDFSDKLVSNVIEQVAVENLKKEKVSTGFEGFDDFRNSLGLEESEEEDGENYSADYETHFNLGIAYKEMGLNDDAVKEFQDAVKLVKANDGTRRHLQCCHLLGHCFMEKSMPKLALIWFEKGLETSDLKGEEKQALFYEIACAHEIEGEKESAFRFFEQIYAVDVEYRDVAKKIKELS